MIIWSIGTRLGPYELLAPIGDGGMGEVWKAFDTRIDRTVAIKRLKSEHAERFRSEARAIAALNHPHICQLYDVGPDYLVMEYVEGKPIQGPLPSGEAVRLSIQIARALEEAHMNGIVHRDIKPGNILKTVKGVKLLDFGLAKVEVSSQAVDHTALTETGMVVGTAAYMSPEQIQGSPVDARSDMFSFGAVMYEILSGRRAFTGETQFATFTAIVTEDPLTLDTPPAIERIVRRCLAKKPAQRFQNMAEARAALELVEHDSVTSRPSIAVLPFANMSGDQEQEYFSDGLAEEIINVLAHLPGLKVIARTSAFAFKGQNSDIRRIAEVLGVSHVLEGSVRKSGSRLRITAQLITARDGSHLWSERFDRNMEDVFAVQDEIAGAIAGALRIQLSADPPAPRHIPPLPAYEAVLKARHYLQKWTEETLVRATQCYEEAIRLDPRFALAYCELGLNYFMIAAETPLTQKEAVARMKMTAHKALEIEPSLAEAHAVHAMVAVLDYDWQEAGREFDIVMAGGPVSPLVRYLYSAFYLKAVGRMEEAMEQTQLGLREDPLNWLLRMSPGLLLLGDENPSGEEVLLKVLDLNDNAWIAHVWLAAYCWIQQRTTDALKFAEKAHALVPLQLGVIGILAGILQGCGNRERSEALRGRLGSGEAAGAPAGFFNFHMISGELDAAAGWLEKAIGQRDGRAPWIMPRMFGRQFTSSPHWPRLAKMMNLPERTWT